MFWIIYAIIALTIFIALEVFHFNFNHCNYCNNRNDFGKEEMMSNSLTTRDELMPVEMLVEKIEQDFGLKLYQYQKYILKMMILRERLKRKAMILYGTSVRCYYGYGKISECHSVDERP